MFRTRFVTTVWLHVYRLPRQASARLVWLLVVCVSSLLGYAAIGPVMAGDGPIPVVEVRLTEFAIQMPTTVPPGSVTFSVTNAGTMEHNFEVEGQGIETKFDTNLKPGETRSLEVDLAAGTYMVYCPVDDHKARGMRLELKVAQQQANLMPPNPEVFLRIGGGRGPIARPFIEGTARTYRGRGARWPIQQPTS
jgi:plastocyanin